jgi:hypothetical protein
VFGGVSDFSGVMRSEAGLQIARESDIVACWVSLADQNVDVVKHQTATFLPAEGWLAKP